MLRMLSMNFDGTYYISTVRDLAQADRHAKVFVNQLHFIHLRTREKVVQWVGEYTNTMCWYDPINPEQAKLAQFYFLLEPQ